MFVMFECSIQGASVYGTLAIGSSLQARRNSLASFLSVSSSLPHMLIGFGYQVDFAWKADGSICALDARS